MEEFINQLIKDAHSDDVVQSIDEETLVQLKSDLKSRLEDLINRRLIDSMSAESLERFEQLIDQSESNPEVLQQFIHENVADAEAITTNALLEFRALYIAE